MTLDAIHDGDQLEIEHYRRETGRSGHLTIGQSDYDKSERDRDEYENEGLTRHFL